MFCLFHLKISDKIPQSEVALLCSQKCFHPKNKSNLWSTLVYVLEIHKIFVNLVIDLFLGQVSLSPGIMEKFPINLFHSYLFLEILIVFVATLKI